MDNKIVMERDIIDIQPAQNDARTIVRSNIYFSGISESFESNLIKTSNKPFKSNIFISTDTFSSTGNIRWSSLLSKILDNNSLLLREIISKIDNLLLNEYDWEYMDYEKPSIEHINFAKDTIIKFFKVVGCYGEQLLNEPYISNSENGGAKIEWHLGERSLYLRIDCIDQIATKIHDKLDGTTIIEDEPFVEQSYLSLWKWVNNE